MKAKIGRGKSFKGLIRYITDRERSVSADKQSEYIGGTVLDSSVNNMTKMFTSTVYLKDVSKPVYHIALAIPKNEKPLDSDTWKRIAEKFLQDLGFPSDTVWCAYRHKDTKCDHIHIIASRVSLSGKVFLGKKDVEKAIRVTQDLEKVFNLTRTPGLDAMRNNLSTGERRLIERTQQLTEKQVIKLYVTHALKESSCFEEFQMYLNERGVEVQLNKARTGFISGISFAYNNVAVKGSKLGSKYSWSHLNSLLPILGIETKTESHTRIKTRSR